MCLVQINFVMVVLKQKRLGLHRMYVNDGTEDNTEVHEIFVKVCGGC